jgi:hypothetical protein
MSSQRRSGSKLPLVVVTGGEYFNVGAADVDDQYIHRTASLSSQRRAAVNPACRAHAHVGHVAAARLDTDRVAAAVRGHRDCSSESRGTDLALEATFCDTSCQMPRNVARGFVPVSLESPDAST